MIGLTIAFAATDEIKKCTAGYGEFAHTPGGLEVVVRRQGYAPVDYRRTDRTVFGDRNSQSDWPAAWKKKDELKGKRVLDAGCGNGSTVRDLEDAGAEAHGVDIQLPNNLKKDGKVTDPRFREADLANTGFPENHFDYVYSSYSVFLYEGDRPAVIQDALRELVRVARHGGRLRLAGADLEAVRTAAAALGTLKEVKVYSQDPNGASGQPRSRAGKFPTGEIEFEVVKAPAAP